VTFDYAVYEVSYANIILYGATLPSYKSKNSNTQNGKTVIDANDPANNEIILAMFK